MMKAVFLALAAVVGSVPGVLVFAVVVFPSRPPFAIEELGVWMEYGSLLFGGVGAIGGVVMGRAAFVRISKPRIHVLVPSKLPPADLTVQARRKCRPLTWLYRP